jgi:hypothetical protein
VPSVQRLCVARCRSAEFVSKVLAGWSRVGGADGEAALHPRHVPTIRGHLHAVRQLAVETPTLCRLTRG